MTTRSGHPHPAAADEPTVGPASPSGVSSANQPLPLHGNLTAITPGSLTIITLPAEVDVAVASGMLEHLTAVMPATADVIMMTGDVRSAPTDQLVEEACEVMHDAYEKAAVGAGWETQKASRKPWADVPDANKATMRAAVTALLAWMASGTPT